MKLGISENTKKLIYCLVGVILVLVAFFFGFQSFRQKNAQLKQQRTVLEEELKKLNEIQANQADYETQIKEYEKQIEKYYKEFPVLVQARDQILYASELENRYDSMLINKLDMGEAEYITGTEGDAMALYRVSTDMECNINYDQLKDFLVHTTEDGTRKAVDEVVLTTDPTTGLLVGQINISMYYMTGTNQVYEPEKVEDVTTGTSNLFQNADTSAQEESVQEMSEEGQ